MSDVQLFKVENGNAIALIGRAVKLEKKLQNMMETHLEAFLSIRFVASEYSTGKTHSGRIDTLGLDENNCPVIIEYKRSSNANVINQGLFYLDWLMDHQAEFELLVMNTLGGDIEIDWSAPRLLCIAEDFNKYDAHAIQQINRNIELLRYRLFGDDLFMLELASSVSTNKLNSTISDSGGNWRNPPKPGDTGKEVTLEADKPDWTIHSKVLKRLKNASAELKELYEATRIHLSELGDDVQETFLKDYLAYKKLKNFATFFIKNQSGVLQMFLALNPSTVVLEDGFTEDYSNKGHWGTGNLGVTLSSLEDLEKAKPLIQKSFEEN